MVKHDPDTTIGIYAGSDAGMIEEFDEFFETKPGQYSRSAQIKRAMEMYLEVQRTLDEYGMEIPYRSQVHYVRQAVRKEARHDSER